MTGGLNDERFPGPLTTVVVRSLGNDLDWVRFFLRDFDFVVTSAPVNQSWEPTGTPAVESFRLCKSFENRTSVRGQRTTALLRNAHSETGAQIISANTEAATRAGPRVAASGLGYFESVRNDGNLNRLFASAPDFFPFPFLCAAAPFFDAPAPLRVITLQSRPGNRVGSAGRGVN